MNSFLIVGKGDCSTLKVHKILRFAPSFHLFGEKWSDVARDLNIPEVDIQSVKGDMLLSKTSLSDALKQMLDLWVGGNGESATLETLLQSLERNGLADCAQTLQKEFQLYTGTAKKYVSIPRALNDWINSDEFVSGLIILTTLDIPITMEKITENLTCEKFFNYEFLLNFLSAGNDWSTLVVTDKDPNTLANLLGNISGSKPFGQIGKLVFVTYEEEKSISETLAKRQLSSTYVRILKDEMEWNDLNYITKHEVRKRAEEYVGFRINDELVESALSGQVLADLINGKKNFQLIKATLPVISSYYVKRNLLTRNIISEKVFKSSSQDVFVFQGISRHELSSMIRDKLTANSSEQLKSVTSKFIVLDHPNHFNKICQLSNDPVHLVRKEIKRKWRWEKSKGGIRSIQKHISKREAQEEMDEDMFLATNFGKAFKENMPVCISDSPGMGKSVLLANIGRNLKKMSRNAIVVFVLLRELIKKIHEEGMDDLKCVVNSSLAEMVGENHLGKLVFESTLNNSNNDKIKIELLLDGLDEVDHSDRFLSHQVLKIIKSTKSVRLWLTSRPHLLEELEQTLCVLGYNLQPFQEKNQIHFLTRFWSERLKMPEESFASSASTCLKILKESINSSEEDIAGIPLQCLMIAEIFQDENTCLGNATISPKSFTFIDLYEVLINKKIELYYKKHDSTRKLSQEEIFDWHVWLSLQLLFPDYADKILPMPETTQQYSEEILKIGLLEASSTLASPRFIHRTFAEYLTAVFVVESLGKNGVTNADFNTLFYDKLLSNELSDCLGSYSAKFQISRFLNHVICHFVNFLIPLKYNVALPKSKHLLHFSTSQEIILASVRHSFNNIYRLFSEIQVVQKFAKFIFKKDLLYNAVMFADLDLIRTVLAHFENYYEFTGETKIETFAEAICKMELSVVEFFLKEKGCEEIMKGIYSTECIGPFLARSVGFTDNTEDLLIRRWMEILRVLLNLNKQAKHQYLHILLFQNRHIKVMIELINLGADLLETDGMYGQTIIHYASVWLDAMEYEEMILNIQTEMLRKLVSMKVESGSTPLHTIFGYFEPTFVTLKILKAAKADFNCCNNYGQSILSVATINGQTSKTLRKLVQFGADVNWEGENGESLLHVAAKHGNVEGVTYYLDEAGLDVNIVDSNYMTPLDYSILDFENKQTAEIDQMLSKRGGLSNIGHFYIRSNLKMTYEELQAIIRKLLRFVWIDKVGYLRNTLAKKSDIEIRNLLITTWLKVIGSNSLLNLDQLIKNPSLNIVMNYLVKSEVSVLERYDGGDILYHWLSCRDDVLITASSFQDICESLVAHGHAQILIKPDNMDGSTPLHLAVQKIDLGENTLQLLSKANVSFNEVDSQHNNLLVYAVRGKRSDDSITNLIKFGVNWKCRNWEGWNLLHHTVVHGNISGLKYFLNLGLSPNDVNSKGQSPLMLYLKGGLELEVVKLLHESGANINAVDNIKRTTLDYLLIGNGFYCDIMEILIFLIDNGADLFAKNDKNCTFVHTWISKHDILPRQFHKFVECLIKNNLCAALEVGGFDHNRTPLHLAIYDIEVNEATLALLHAAGVNFNSEDRYGRSLLNYAILGKQSFNLIDRMIKYGANLFHLDKNGKSLFHHAAQNGNAETLDFLIAKASISIRDIECGENHFGEYQAGLDVNRQDIRGDTPLAMVAEADVDSDLERHDESESEPERIKGIEEKVSFLLEVGADVSIKNNDGLYPLGVIMNNGFIDKDTINRLAKLMLQHSKSNEFTSWLLETMNFDK